MKPGDYVRVLPPFDGAFPDPEYQIVAEQGGAFRLSTGSDFAPEYLALVREGVLPGSRILTRLAFRNRFTQAEKEAIYTAAVSAVSIRVWLDDLMVAEEVRLDDPVTQAGIQALEQAGLIGAGRAAEILEV